MIHTVKATSGSRVYVDESYLRQYEQCWNRYMMSITWSIVGLKFKGIGCSHQYACIGLAIVQLTTVVRPNLLKDMQRT